jgi:type IV secretion system protein VirB4
MCLFDRDNALKAVTLLHGGQHYALGSAGSLRLPILGDIDTEAQQQWATIWLENVLTGEGLPPEPEERRELWRTVQMLADLPRSQRTLSMTRQLVQVTRLKVGLSPFCEGGEYSFCDGSTQTVAWGQRLLCFEMSGLLTKPRALAAVLSYCFHQLETHWFTGEPVVLVIDEAKWLLDGQRFLGELEVWLKARAKKNVSVWLATQELADLQRTTLWQAVLASMPTRILLPNPQALSAPVRPFYTDVGVSDRGLHQLAQAQPFRDYLYVSPLGTRLFQCTLSPVERLLCAASGWRNSRC